MMVIIRMKKLKLKNLEYKKFKEFEKFNFILSEFFYLFFNKINSSKIENMFIS